MKRGMTLIEIFVVIAVMMILSAIAITAIVTTRQNRQISTAADKIKGIIIESRMEVITRPENLATAFAIEVRFEEGGKIEYFSHPETGTCNIDTATSTAITPLVSDVSLPSNLHFAENYSLYIANNTCGGNFLGSLSGAPKVILSDGTTTYHLDIYPAGGVDVQKGE